MNIGLMGFELESPNKGCEALSYAFVGYLNEVIKIDLTIIVLDSDRLGAFPKTFDNVEFRGVKPGLKKNGFRLIQELVRCDIVFDITMGDSFSDIYSESYCNSLIRRKRIAEMFNHKYVLMPQTYGPFKNASIREKALGVIKKAYKVYSRDKASVDYLNQYGINREIPEHIDLAFMLPYDKDKYDIDKSRKNLGINVSGLLWKGGFHSNNQFELKIDYKEYISTIIQHFVDKDWNVHLIPHVIDKKANAHDDDYKIICELHNTYPDTILAPAFENPIEAKSYIANMDCFIGARMHSTIGAISAGVPVIPVSYSRKFEGLFSSLNYEYLIHGKKSDTDTAVKTTIDYARKINSIKNDIEVIQSDIKDRVGSEKQEFNRVLSSIQRK